MATEAHIYRNGIAAGRKEAAAEIAMLRALISEVVGGDWIDAAYALELPSRLAESGWFKRARAALTSYGPPKG